MPDVTMLAIEKDGEKYVFLYDDEHEDEMRRTLGRFARDPELSFTWQDAAQLSKSMRESGKCCREVGSGKKGSDVELLQRTRSVRR